MNKFDIIIIDAGPGGLECARSLQDSGLSILMLERNSSIGPKPCGGGITTQEKIVDIPDSSCKLFDTELFILKKQQSYLPLKFTRKVFDRFELGQYQLSKLNRDRVNIHTGEIVTQIFADKIVTNKNEYAYRYLVGADGSNSIVRKYLGQPIRFCTGIYYEIPGDFSTLVSYYDPSSISMGYIWEFPHKTHNNVGIYFDPNYLTHAKAKTELDKYILSRGYSLSTAKLYSSIINYNYLGHKFNNIFLLGDAAGLASRLHGGGINNAMESGRDIANLILNKDHKCDAINAIIKQKRKEDFVLNLLYKSRALQTIVFKLLMILLKLRIV